MTTTATRTVVRITFEKVTCDRCGGTGQMPFAAYGGVCFKCNGKGELMTAKGRKAYLRLEAWAEENLKVAASSLKPGDKIIEGGGRRTVEEVETKLGKGNGISRVGTGDGHMAESWTLGETTITTKRMVYMGAAHRPVRLAWTRESLTQAAPILARLSGATITYADEVEGA